MNVVNLTRTPFFIFKYWREGVKLGYVFAFYVLLCKFFIIVARELSTEELSPLNNLDLVQNCKIRIHCHLYAIEGRISPVGERLFPSYSEKRV